MQGARRPTESAPEGAAEQLGRRRPIRRDVWVGRRQYRQDGSEFASVGVRSARTVEQRPA